MSDNNHDKKETTQTPDAHSNETHTKDEHTNDAHTKETPHKITEDEMED